MTRTEAETIINELPETGGYDFAMTNGPIRSSKTLSVTTDENGTTYYDVFHDIDGSVTYFTREGAIGVVMGTRDPWDGDAESEAE